ncbi:hypothetical protein BVRB_013270 [Beta vulgaris subsp. vulgaris]|uniref:Uncharacterized protein n=1 Tax=Beta vulgaris subsp. vulgaris TaxID=3555 RepID=A0A0J8DVZ6_BETVV|nr:hypothetical protein BVRB_013270 [Beta vulgaris subsp. vulgaris]
MSQRNQNVSEKSKCYYMLLLLFIESMLCTLNALLSFKDSSTNWIIRPHSFYTRPYV